MTTNIIHIAETDSTNRYLRDLPAPAADITVVVADHQTAGRGQGTNSWESEAGANLLFSMLIRPKNVPVARQFLLSMTEALALKDALGKYASDITLKWPNDVYWRDLKLSGTLIETAVAQSWLKTCIFGTGINVNQLEFRSDAPNPVSLRQITGRETSVEEVLRRVLEAFEHYLEMLEQGCHERISALYHEALYRRTGFHPYRDQGGMFEAELLRVEENGTLVLRDRAGVERRYGFKEVAFVIGAQDK